MIFRPITWNEVEESVAKLKEDISSSPVRYSAIYGEPRGGLVLATMLSHHIGLPLLSQIPECSDGMGILWVDDIYDSGLTCEKAMKAFPHITPMVMFMREGMAKYAVAHTHDAKAGEWLVFPWEDKAKAQQDLEQYETSRK